MADKTRPAAFFDLDKTIIAMSSSSALSRPLLEGGLLTRTAALRTGYAALLFHMGGADERKTNRLRDALAELIRGWDVERLNEILDETLHEYIDPVVFEEALELIHAHHELGRDVVIVSASAEEVVRPIAALLGADAVIATRMTVEDGHFTGEIDFYAFGENKAVAMAELAAERGYDLARSYAYSDSITDMPMLQAVGHGYAVNPDRALRREALENGWGILRFRKPIALRSAPSPASVAVGVALVIGVVVGAVLVSRAVRRRRWE
ncbi:MAG: HAD-IB family hydrolase [Demequina sp.]|jgi:HAD superfamily hydrolase (TIGR01490 family)|nr:HAD-IB family hydrolase [Demequina sp.]